MIRGDYALGVGFQEALQELGFALAEERPSKGAQVYAASPNRFLTYWVHLYPDDTALFTWEFAIAEFLERHAMQIGANEALNLFMFPSNDERGPQEQEWLAATIDRTVASLAALEFAPRPRD